ncbi:amino acid transporter [Teratosphaeria nubilosa]|uniref:Amino acid transporter n=1 Tax=Teratosphaeria nubilosa TaxID=161662 RepID=A0A6G1LDT0_9PEZI|nr:amino acid transporter [Teratosphaeria nubilosa]
MDLPKAPQEITTALPDPDASANRSILSLQDALDMGRLNVRQETKRRFKLVTLLGFTTTMMCTWESAIPFFVTSYVNGGGPTMLYGFLFAFLGALATCASMAELASMYPIAGGQYHWVALLAPDPYKKTLSWLTGWVSTLGWQAAASTGFYLGGTVIQVLVSLNQESYVPRPWQATMIMIAIMLTTVFVNTTLIKLLPGMEGLVLLLHVVGFFAVLIPMVHLAPISSSEFVWTEFNNLSGYSSGVVSWLIGQAGSAVLFIGYDGACHLAEEVENAAVNVPRAMFFTIFINGALGFATYIMILYCLGDPMAALNTVSGEPFIEIFNNALRSKAGTTALTSLLVSLYIFATFGFVASASRQAWAFARSGGLPYSHIFRQVNTSLSIPIHAILLTGTTGLLLSLINIGSSIAFNAVISLTTASYLSSYIIVIVLMIHKRLTTPEKLVFGPWTLGRLGLPINIFAAGYSIMTVVFSFFPPQVPIKASSMNWSCAVYGGVLVLGVVYYVVKGHRQFESPVESNLVE